MLTGLPLSAKSVLEIMRSLTEEQRVFVESTFKQGKKSKWIEILAKRKGVVFDTTMTFGQIVESIDDWILQDILDGGYLNRPYRCECGKPLRFQYIVHHQRENKTYKLGETCFEHYTSLPPEVLRDIKQGFHHIDLERDELLLKYKNGINYNLEPYLQLDLPAEIRRQIELGLPLIDKQWDKIERLREEAEEKKRLEKAEKRLKEIEENLTAEQKEWIEAHFKTREKRELLINLANGFWPHYETVRLKEIGVPDNIIHHIELGLPVLDSQISTIKLHTSNNREKDIKTNRTAINYDSIDYETLISKHMDSLKAVREREQSIPRGLLSDWEVIQETVRKSKKGEQIDYRRFLLLLSNLLSALGIRKSVYS